MPFRVLLVKTSSIGDVIHALPVAETLRRTYPHIQLTWVVEGKALEILTGNPYVDELIVVHFQRWKRSLHRTTSWKGLLQLLRRLRTGGFHLALDLQGLLRSGLITLLSKAPVRIGLPRDVVRERGNLLFTNVHGPRAAPGSHVVDQNLALLGPVGIHRPTRSFYLWTPPEVTQEVQRYLEGHGRGDGRVVVALNPCGGWETKRWPLDRFAAIGDRIVKEYDADLYLLWGPGEEKLAEGVRCLMREQAYCIPPMSLKHLAGLLRQCDVFLGGDSGPLHIASALGTAVLGIYGPSDPLRNGPFNGRWRVVRYKGPCTGCYKRKCPSRECMEQLSIEEVWDAFAELMRERDQDTRGEALAAR